MQDFTSPSNVLHVRFYVYPASATYSFSTQVRMFFASDAGFANYYQWNITHFVPGWNDVVVRLSDATSFTIYGNPDWSGIRVLRLQFTAGASLPSKVSWDLVAHNYTVNGGAKIILSCDDGMEPALVHQKPILDANGFLCTAFVPGYVIGTTGHLTWAQLDELYAAGWDISNHTKNHEVLTGLPQAEMIAEIDDQFRAFVNRGYRRSAKFFAYVGGSYNDAVIAATKVNHVLGRGVAGGSQNGHIRFDGYREFIWPVKTTEVGEATTWASIQQICERAIYAQALFTLYWHGIADTTNFAGIMAALKAHQDAGRCQVMSFSQYYDWVRGVPAPAAVL